MNPERSKIRVETDAVVRPAKAKPSGWVPTCTEENQRMYSALRILFTRDSQLGTRNYL